MRGYAYAKVYGALERRGIDALTPTKAEPIRSPVPLRRFRYDAKHDIVKCPRGKILRPGNPVAHGRFLRPQARLRSLRSGLDLFVEGPLVERARDQSRLPGAAAGATVPGALVGGGPAAVSTAPLALGGLPRRGEDLAWAGPGGPTRAPEHADPGLLDRFGHQLEAARRRSCDALVGANPPRRHAHQPPWRSTSLIRRHQPRRTPDRAQPNTPDPGFSTAP